MDAGSKPTFFRMVRQRPVRTAVFTVVPFVFAGTQVLYSTLTAGLDPGTLLFTWGFAAAVLAFGVAIHRYHLARFRRTELASRTDPASAGD